MLHGGAYPSSQNEEGDQPAHIAARYDQLPLLRQIAVYCKHMGRVNFSHQTPLGVSKFHQSERCSAFLQHHYRVLEGDRQDTGELWWDKQVDQRAGDWVLHVTSAGVRSYENMYTGEVSDMPPAISYKTLAALAETNEVSMQRAVTIVTEENTLTKHSYYKEYAEFERDVGILQVDASASTVITKNVRRKLAYLERDRLTETVRVRRILTRWVKRHMPGFMQWRRDLYTAAVTKIQAAYRGFRGRRSFYLWPGGRYWSLRQRRAHYRLRYSLWGMWKLYQRRQELLTMHTKAANMPVTLADWQAVVDRSKAPIRQEGMYEEYHFPNTRNVLFYRHALTGNCMFDKPAQMQALDEERVSDAITYKRLGSTPAQIALATKLQTLWRGYQIRHYSQYVERAMEVSLYAEQKYLTEPTVDSHLYNYALHCLVGLQDMERARRVFIEALRRMQWRGPDLSFVLYAYSVYSIVSRDESYMDVVQLLYRARQAEEELDTLKRARRGEGPSLAVVEGRFQHGRSFDLANTGFFRHAAVSKNNQLSWECYAVCRFLIYNDFNGRCQRIR
jgi:hypothetical protein